MVRLWTFLAISVAMAAPPGAWGASANGVIRGGGCIASASADRIASARVEYGDDPANVDAESEIKVGPPLIDIRAPLEAGDTFICTITVRNRRDADATVDLTFTGVAGSRSGVRFIELGDPELTNTAAGWLEAEPVRLVLKPRQFARVPVVLRVPNDPPVGSAYAALQLNVRPTDDVPGAQGAPNVGIRSRIAIPFLLRVGGEGEPKLRIGHERAPRVRWNRDAWQWRANLDNDGTLHAMPQGRVRVRSIFGRTIAELGIASRPLLPGGRVELASTWQGVPWFGIYRYDTRIGDARDSGVAPARSTGWFLALPPWWVLALAGIALGLVGTGLKVRRRASDTPDEHTFDEWN